MLDSHIFLSLWQVHRRGDSGAVGQRGGPCGKHTGFVRVLIEPQIHRLIRVKANIGII